MKLEDKINIRNLSIAEISSQLKDANFPAFRAKQIFEWLWKKNVGSFQQMGNLGKDIILFLEEKYYIDFLQLKDQQVSKDKTIKCAFSIADNKIIEGVLIPTNLSLIHI